MNEKTIRFTLYDRVIPEFNDEFTLENAPSALKDIWKDINNEFYINKFYKVVYATTWELSPIEGELARKTIWTFTISNDIHIIKRSHKE